MYLRKMRLDGRVAFVTGGAQGIGLAAAEALREAGAKVITGDLQGADMVLDVTDFGAGRRGRRRDRGARGADRHPRQ